MLPLITARMHNALHRTTTQLRTHRMLAYIPPFVVLPTLTLDKVSSLVVDSSINCLFSSLPLFLLPPPFVLSFRLASGSTQDSAETKKRANETLYRNRAKQLSFFFLFHCSLTLKMKSKSPSFPFSFRLVSLLLTMLMLISSSQRVQVFVIFQLETLGWIMMMIELQTELLSRGEASS